MFVIILFGDLYKFAHFTCKLLLRLSCPLPLFSFESVVLLGKVVNGSVVTISPSELRFTYSVLNLGSHS